MTMDGAQEIALGVWPDDMAGVRAELLAAGIAQVRARAHRYVEKPGEAAWHELVEALTRTYGDSETYELLRAVEIHSRASNGR
jgi:hypothetical protein